MSDSKALAIDALNLARITAQEAKRAHDEAQALCARLDSARIRAVDALLSAQALARSMGIDL